MRDIEIFLTLTEELHFGRAADRLHVSQARVSQAINQQERRLGGALFDRTNRRQIRLTPLGRQLRDDLRPVYAGLRDSLERAHLAARGKTARLRVGLIPGNAHDLRPYWETFRARHPQWELHIRHAPYNNPFAGLRADEIDVLIAWLPVEEPDLTVGPTLFRDPRVLAVAVDHELAARPSASLEMLADFRHTTSDVPVYWGDSYLPTHTPGGHMIERGPRAINMDELLTLVSVGEVVNVLPAHSTRYWPRPDIVWLPFRDFDPLHFGMVWRTDTETDLIRALAQTVRDLGPLEPQR
ncbi:LysR family transcriptional regulator [Microbispora corallina]